MEMVTGKPASGLMMPTSDEDLLALLRDAGKRKRPLVAGSMSEKRIDANQAGGFAADGANRMFEDVLGLLGDSGKKKRPLIAVPTPEKSTAVDQAGGFAMDWKGSYSRTFTATGLPTNEPESPLRIQPGSLEIRDVNGKAQPVKDDAEGELAGPGATGTVVYDDGKVMIAYDESHRPRSPEDLRANFTYRGVIDGANNVNAHHAYIFERIDENGLIVLRNPWGKEHPKPLTIEAFRASFTTLSAIDDE
jgi:hypothetical protein